MHRLRQRQVKVLESYAPTDFTIGELAVRKGTWLLAVRVSPTSWGAREVRRPHRLLHRRLRRAECPEPAVPTSSKQPTNNQHLPRRPPMTTLMNKADDGVPLVDMVVEEVSPSTAPPTSTASHREEG